MCVCVAVFVFSTAIGIRCKDGVVFGVEKLVLSKLYEEGSNKRIFNIDKHVGMVNARKSNSRWRFESAPGSKVSVAGNQPSGWAPPLSPRPWRAFWRTPVR